MKINNAALIILLGIATVPVSPAGPADMPVRGFDQARYEYSYSGVERASDPEQWLQKARSGVAFAVACWERDAVDLYADPSSLAIAMLELKDWSTTDIANRFSVWLRDRFFGRQAAELRQAVAEATRAANEQYLYVTSPDGTAFRDEAGNPRYLSHSEGLPLDQAQSAWNSGTASAARKALESYGTRLESICPELLSYIPETERGLFEPRIAAAMSEARVAIASEFDNLVAREERLFVARKTTDVWSLRNQSESEAASVIAAALAREAVTECDEGLVVLNARIEAASVNGGELSLAGTEWLAAFKLQFDRGLTTWKNAEERFMVRRLEWERDAAQAFNSGNETWSKAFEALTSERKAWEVRAASLFRSGEDAFSRASETLETNIREAKAEFEQAASERCMASSDRASAWVDVYLQSGAAAAGAREGAGYWLSLLGYGVPAFSDPGLGSWLASEAAMPGISAQRKDWFAQASDCLQVYNQYTSKAIESRDRLTADFGLAIGTGTGYLRDVLDEGALAEDFCLDEYQVELIRAKAIEGYWARRVEIADAVLQYAVDLSSGRATAGDNIRNLQTASTAWNDALRLYDIAQAQLKAAGTVIAGAGEAMTSAREELVAAGARLENLNAEYSILMGVLLAGDTSFIRDEIIARYRDLIEQSGLSETEGAPSEAGLLATYLEKARASGYAVDFERSGEALRTAVNGFEGEPSLAQLKSTWAEILVPADPSDAPLEIDAYGIPETGTEYAAIQNLLVELQKNLGGAGTALERSSILESYKILISKIARIAKTSSAAVLEARLDSIALLGASSTAGWYADRTGGRILTGTLEAKLVADQRVASRAFLVGRAELELETANVIAGFIPPGRASDDANSLARWWSGAGIIAQAACNSLLGLVDFLHDNINAEDTIFNAGIEALALRDASIASFVRGKGFFQAGGLDIGSLYSSTESMALERARGRLSACLGYGSTAMALEEERYSSALAVLGGALAPLGLLIGEHGALPGARAIITVLFSDGIDTATAMAGLLSAANEAASLAPGWMALELSGWKEALLDYAAAKSQYLGLPSTGDSAGYRAALNDASEQIAVFSTVMAGLAGDEASALRALCRVVSEPIWSAAELKMLEFETARRMALNLRARVADFGLENPGGEPDWGTIETMLSAEADKLFGFAASGMRNQAVGVALDDLRGIDAVVNSRNPSGLAGVALDARLSDIWSGLDFEGTKAIADSAGNPIARIAYSMRALVFDPLAELDGGAVREDLIALSTCSPEGEPGWLDKFYASEGQDSGAVMQSLLEIAAGSVLEPWSLELARSRVEVAAVDSLSGIIEYRDGLRRDLGSASGVAERLLAEFLAMGASDPGYFSWEIDALGLWYAVGLKGFTGTQISDGAAMAEAFLGLGSDQYAHAAASHYLASLALSGYTTAFDTYSARAGVDASSRANAILQLKTVASGYAGEYSGHALSWACLNNIDNPEKAIAMVQYLESGFVNDPLCTYPGWNKPNEGASSPINRWLSEALTNNAEKILQSIGKTAALLVWSEACESASQRTAASAATGELHWRQYLLSPAILNSSSGLATPLLAGNPEGDRGAVPRSAAGWAEGTLVDACEESERRTNALTAAIESWAGYLSESAVPTAPAAYLLAPDKPFAAEDVVRASALTSSEYHTAAEAYASLGYRRADTVVALSGFAKAFLIASDQGAVSARLGVLQQEQISARAASEQAMLGYHETGAAFDAAGVEYETAYSRANRLYVAQETARSEYELEDAISRWAGTAYLAATEENAPDAVALAYRSPGAELEYARLGHDRAASILGSLLELNAGDGELRSYADPSYEAASTSYELNYRNLVLLAKARDAMGGALAKSYVQNDAAYGAYQANLYGSQASGYPPVAIIPVDYSAYAFPADASTAGWLDFLTLRADGSIGLAYGTDFRLTPVGDGTSARLAEYYHAPASSVPDEDLYPATRYELDVRDWSSRIAGYMVSPSDFSTWANARDYLISNLASANPEYLSLTGSISHADNLYATIGEKRIDGDSITDMLGTFVSGELAVEQRAAWESLAAQERADLEFYVAMSLSGGAERSNDSFETATKLREYQYISTAVSSRIDASTRLAHTLGISGAASWTLGILLCWTPAGPALLGAAMVQFGLSLAATADADDWQHVKTTVLDSGLDVQQQTMLSGLSVLSSEASGIQTAYATYHESCRRIASIMGENKQGADILADFRSSLELTGELESAEIEDLVNLYQYHMEETASVSAGSYDALSSIYRSTLSKRDAARLTLENCYFDDQRARQRAEAVYHEAASGYLSGTVSEAALISSMQAAFGGLAASGKTHLSRLAGMEQAVVFDTGIDASSREYAESVSALAALTARAIELRYSAELISREAGWDLQRSDLNEKRLVWRQSASLIIERGRADFDDGANMLREQATVWTQRFSDAYLSRKPAWDLAYAGMQDEKLSWVAQATDTAGKASAVAMLALMTPDAEAAVRKLDCFSVSRLDFDVDPQLYYDDIMKKVGLGSMESAFALHAGSVATLSLAAGTGMSRAGSLDSGRIMTAAADFAEQARQRVSGVQARLIAGRARSVAAAAVDGLASSVRQANESFSERMTEVFIDGGMWRRQGSRYVKDIVVNSTVGTPYITEQAGVEAFRYFAMSDWRLVTDLSDGTLAGLGAASVRDLIGRAEDEVRTKREEVFGSVDDQGAAAVASRSRSIDLFRSERGIVDTRTMTWTDDEGVSHSKDVDVYGMLDVLDHTEVQIEGAGEFGRHLGYAPVARIGANPDDGEDGVFQAAGSGELGRMMASYIYWSLKEGQGWSEANKPLYEKDLWDDRGNWLQAPTIRGVADIGVTVAAGILTGGFGAIAMNLVDDAAFGLLDISGGYQSWEQASLDFGKKAALSVVDYSGSQLFGSALSRVASTGGLQHVAGATMLSGMRAAGTGIAASAIGAISLEYDGFGEISGLGFNAGAFRENAFGEASVASYVGSMAGAAFNASIDFKSAYSRKLYSGITGIGSMAATESMKLATHLGYSAARGETGYGLFDEAWNNHGGITLDVANLGSLMSATGFLDGVSSTGYSATNRAGYNRLANAFSGVGLSLNLGIDGINGSLGGGGYNLVHMGMQVGKGLLLDAKLEKFAIAQGSTAASILKTVIGYGDSAAEETVWRLAGGRDTLSFDSVSGKAETVAGSTGNRIISILESGGGTGAMLDMAVMLQHESWRDGKNGTVAMQSQETLFASKAHTQMAMGLALGNEYGESMLSLITSDQNYQNDLNHYVGGDFVSYVGRAYDASGDFWKLTKDGKLINDGKARLLSEIVNDDGTTGWHTVEDSLAETSTAAALVHYLGESRAMELFSSSLCDVTKYDDQTLHDVLNLDYIDIKTIRNNPGEAARVIASASSGQRERLLGEALMKGAAIQWNTEAQNWSGDGIGLKLSDRAIIGSAAIRSLGDGSYERYSITSEIERREGAYGVWMNGIKGDVGEGNTRVAFTKWDLDSGEQLATIVAGGAWNSVDNSTGQLDSSGRPIGADQPYQIVFGPTLQGNTIAEGPLNLRLAQTSKADWGDVFIISNTKTIAGELIADDGRRPGYPFDYRWLGHGTKYGSSDGCPVYKMGDDDTDQFSALIKSLAVWGLYSGYSISGMLHDYNDFPYQLGYKKGVW